MGNILIAVFVAMFFWGKASKKTREKTKEASFLKTVLYFVLSIFVGVFFYKTYQVATIYNGIQVSAFRASYDTSGRIADTIPTIEIYNRFSSLSYNNALLKIRYTKDPNVNSRDYFSEIGGVRFDIYSHNDSPFVVKETPIVKDNPLSILKLPKENPNQVYAIAVFMTGIPNLIPINPVIKYNSGWEKYSDIFYSKSMMNEMKDDPAISFQTEEGASSSMPDVMGYVFKQYGAFYNVEQSKPPYSRFFMYARNAFSNTLNIFTAADISQYTHMISIYSDCHVKEMAIDYDIPIETTQINEDMMVGSKAILIKERLLENFLNGPSLFIHVKLPTMANIQLIRSLVLTALLSALLSLLSQNLFYFLRKLACYYRNKYKLPYSKAKLINRKQVRNFRRIIYFFFFLLLIILLIVSYLLLTDKTISLSEHIYDFGVYYLIGIFVLILIFICWQYSKLRNPKLSAVQEDKNVEEFHSIFLHDKNEDEEYDRMVQEMYDKSNNKED